MARLARRIARAAEQKDWKDLALAERVLSVELPALAAQGEWTPDERLALTELWAAHRGAQENCAAELALLEKKMAEIRVTKEGMLAYAQSIGSEER